MIDIIQLDDFVSFTLAIVVLFFGKTVIARYQVLQRYSIPEPVVGGLACAGVTAILFYGLNIQLNFELDVRDMLLLYFFAGIGLKADVSTIKKGGKPLLILLLLSLVFIFLQNGFGVGIATLFDKDPITGLLSGSISLIGGVGTTMAWAPTFIDDFGITNAKELGIASNTLGLIFACVIGGPIASYLIKKHKLSSSHKTTLDIGVTHDEKRHLPIDYFGVLRAWAWLNIALILGYTLDALLDTTGLKLPTFVACLMAGIVIGNIGRTFSVKTKGKVGKQAKDYIYDVERGLTLIQDICLGMFLTMALMSLQIWELEGNFLYIFLIIAAQVFLSVAFTVFVVFKAMGKDYESAVICSGFGGVTLGSTATAIVNMTAVTQQFGAAHRAFIILPLVCGFFIDIANAVIISLFLQFFQG